MSSTMDDLIGRERREQLEAEANARHDEMHAALMADDHPAPSGPYRVCVVPAKVSMKDSENATVEHLLSIGRDPEGHLVIGQVTEIGTSGSYRFAGLGSDLPEDQRFAPQRVDLSPTLLDALSTADEQKRMTQGKVFEVAVDGRTRPVYATSKVLQRAMGVWRDHGGQDHAVGELLEQVEHFRAGEQADPDGFFRDPDQEASPSPAAQVPTKNSPFAAAFRRIAGRVGEQQTVSRPSRPAERFRPRPVVEMDDPSQGPNF